MSKTVAAVYIRVSTEDQAEYSPDAQLRQLRRYAEDHELVIDERYIFTDQGISGRKAETRPGFQAMIRAARLKDHPFDVILVHKYDRFARSREDSVVYKSILRRCGVAVVSITEPISQGNYAGVMEAIYESFAEAYSINLAQEVKKGMTEKALRGQLQTCPPYGYRVRNHKLVPQEEEAIFVRYLFSQYAEGSSFRALASALNDAGARTRRGNPFESRSISYILNNPVYIGLLRWDPSGRVGRNPDTPDRIVMQSGHPPLVEKSLWDLVQAKLQQQRASRSRYGKPAFFRKHWLSGILRCGCCGATMSFSSSGYFRCSKYLRGSCSQSQHISVSLPEASIRNAISLHLSNASVPLFEAILSDRSDLEICRTQLAHERAKLIRLEEGYLCGAFDAKQLIERKRQILEQIRALELQCTGLKQSAPAADKITLNREIRQVLSNPADVSVPVEALYRSMRAVTESLHLFKEAGTLRLVYQYRIRRIPIKDQSMDSYSRRSFDSNARANSGLPRQTAGNERSPSAEGI